MSTATVNGIDMESLKLIADSVARSAASQVADQLEAKMTEQHAKLKNEITDEFRRDLKGYFGNLQSDEHIIQHSRIDKLLNFIDKTGENFIGRIVSALAVWGAILLVVGYAIYAKVIA
jgi:hypothetical protein